MGIYNFSICLVCVLSTNKNSDCVRFIVFPVQTDKDRVTGSFLCVSNVQHVLVERIMRKHVTVGDMENA